MVLLVDLENPVHPHERDGEAAGDGDRPAREARARPARDQRHAMGRGEAHDPGDLVGRRWEGHGQRRRRLEVGRLVAAMRLQVGRVDGQPEPGQRRPKRLEEGRAGELAGDRPPHRPCGEDTVPAGRRWSRYQEAGSARDGDAAHSRPCAARADGLGCRHCRPPPLGPPPRDDDPRRDAPGRHRAGRARRGAQRPGRLGDRPRHRRPEQPRRRGALRRAGDAPLREPQPGGRRADRHRQPRQRADRSPRPQQRPRPHRGPGDHDRDGRRRRGPPDRDRPDDPPAAGRRPPAGRGGRGPARLHGALRDPARREPLALHVLRLDVGRVPLAPMGERGPAVRPGQSRRPLHHGLQPVGPRDASRPTARRGSRPTGVAPR